MELFIRLVDGVPFQHPMLGDNFREAFPEVDVNNLPAEFAKFVRVAPPIIGVYEVYEGATYERVGDIYTDVHHVRPMTAEEKLAKQDKAKAEWDDNPGWTSWLFDKEAFRFVPPTPYPTDGGPYYWDEPTLSWIEVTPEYHNG
jgi:hypothetical protein